MFVFYLLAIFAITGKVGYQYLVKCVPETLNPIVSEMVCTEINPLNIPFGV